MRFPYSARRQTQAPQRGRRRVQPTTKKSGKKASGAARRTPATSTDPGRGGFVYNSQLLLTGVVSRHANKAVCLADLRPDAAGSRHGPGAADPGYRQARQHRPHSGHHRRNRRPADAPVRRRADPQPGQPDCCADEPAARRAGEIHARRHGPGAPRLGAHRRRSRRTRQEAGVTMAQKLYIKTFGCQMNEYDSAKMADVLVAAEGMQTTADPAEADVILFNTCSVREKAQEKVFHDLGRVKRFKLARPCLVIGVGGCVASQEGAAIVARAPYVDLVFGPQTLHRLPALIEARRRSGRPQVDISFPEIEKFDRLPPARVAGVSAFVSIMEGCSKYCSFCVVPYTRGEEISRPFEDVLTDVAELALSGVKEVT